MKHFISFCIVLLIVQSTTAQLTTASNGLTASSTNVSLGGTLSQNTSIDVGSSYNFEVKKNSDSYLKILNNGYMGIGVSSPSYPLHLPYTSKISIGEADAAWVTDGVNLATSGLKFRNHVGGGSYSVGIRPNGYSIETFDGNTGLIAGSGIRTDAVIAQNFVSYNNYYVAKILDGSFQVGGEGYSTPAFLVKSHTAVTPGYYASMYVYNSLAFNPSTVAKTGYNIHLTPTSGTVNDHATGITFGATDSHQEEAQAGIYVNSGGSYGTKMYFGTTNDFAAGSKIRMVLDHQGNLGVGTNTPQAKLDVNGNIFSSGKIVIGTTDAGQYGSYALAVNGTGILNKVKVKAYGNWPDYVFADDHKLPTLTYVEHFIKKNKHLPEVPSAAEIEKEDIDLGDMQALMLKKIEELTLYVIDLNKKDEELIKEMEALKYDNKELKKQLQQIKKQKNQ